MSIVTFAEALKSESLENIRRFPKSDLHNHFVLGGSREYIFRKTGYKIEPVTQALNTMSEMDAWSGMLLCQDLAQNKMRKTAANGQC